MANGSIRIDADFTGVTKQVQDLINKFNQVDKPVQSASASVASLVDDCKAGGQSMVTMNKDAVALAKALGGVATQAKQPRQALSELKKVLEESTHAYNQLTDAEKASPFGKALKSSIDQLTGRAKEMQRSIKGVSSSLRETNTSAKASSSVFDGLSSKLGMSLGSFTKLASAAGLASTALSVLKDAFLHSESNIDSWGRTVEGAKGAYDAFLNTLVNGDWSSFFSNLETAIKGASDLYDKLDRLGSIKGNNAAAIAIVQEELQRLRLLKQQGENVDAEIKAATERLAILRGQEVNAGKVGGVAQMTNTLRNAVGTGSGINNATLNFVSRRLLNNGQGAFDAYRRTYETLQERGSKTVSVRDNWGKEYTQRVFNIERLTEQERKQYLIAKAVTERETELQKGIATYAQAVNQNANAHREEFRYNRYALQGNNGKGSSSSSKPFDYMKGVRDFNTYDHDFSTKPLNVFDSLGMSSLSNSELLKILQVGHSESYGTELSSRAKYKPKDKKDDKDKKESEKITDSLNGIVGGVGNIVSGLESLGIEIPEGLKQVLSGMSGIASILTGISTTIMAVSLLPFAKGGIVHAASGIVAGHNYLDRVPATLTSGEMVINEADQKRLWDGMKSGNFGGVGGGGNSTISGEQIVTVINAYGRRTGRGEILR